jgi:hypothetical protein
MYASILYLYFNDHVVLEGVIMQGTMNERH